MRELPARDVTIIDSFWSARLEINATRAIFHQWSQLEKSGCIDNFRIVAGEKQGFREGWVFADSDAYKWLDAAARIYAISPSDELKQLMDELIALLARTQMADGYINTYNQYHFQGQRWVNLQIEHELYCLGHLIEAGVSHFEATGESRALEIARRAADLLVTSFKTASPERTEGHQEIEIALMRLFMATGQTEYLDLAQNFIELRGRIHFFALIAQREYASHQERKAYINTKRSEYALTHPEYSVSKIPADNESKNPPFSKLRRQLNAWRGFYNQQHAPVRQQTIPVGHSVRYGYFQTATAMLHRLRGDASLLPALQQSWEHLVCRRMYVTGGIGSLPGNEGFGFDYELDPEYAYNETCAALASLFWNWEMALATRQAQYSDLFEWQLYNAAAVGMGLNGETYLYNNPLSVQRSHSVTRKAWYSVPCCPPNLSRTWASLGKYIYSHAESDLWIHQYFGNETSLEMETLTTRIRIDSQLPFDGCVTVQLDPVSESKFRVNLRIPSWCLAIPGGSQASGCKVSINGTAYPFQTPPYPAGQIANGFDPRGSFFLPISRSWSPGDMIKLEFDMPVMLRHAHPKVKNHQGKVAITRGPLVYCLESNDNPGVDIFTTRIDPASLLPVVAETELGRITTLRGKSVQGQDLTFIPYQMWANRGASQMTVWVNG